MANIDWTFLVANRTPEHSPSSVKPGPPDLADTVFQNVRIRDAGVLPAVRRARASRDQQDPLSSHSSSDSSPGELPDAFRSLLRKAVVCINTECSKSHDYSPVNSQQLNIICSNVSGMIDNTQSNILVAHFIRSFSDCVPLLPASESLSWAITTFNACMDHRQHLK